LPVPPDEPAPPPIEPEPMPPVVDVEPPEPIVPLVDPLSIEPDVLVEGAMVPFELLVPLVEPSLIEPAVPVVVLVAFGVPIVLLPELLPIVPLLLCANATPEKAMERASAEAKILRVILFS
jgi:hypothetical protein